MSTLPEDLPIVACVSCNALYPITEFRVLSAPGKQPVQFMDFCPACEATHGLPALVRDYAHAISREMEALYKRILKTDEIVAVEQDRSQLVQRELARRELCRRHLIYYITQFYPNYVADWVHQDVCRRLERFVQQVERGESPRLILNLPPRHGKEVAHDTPVLTPDGWTTHGALRAGDYVFHPSGEPVRVVAIAPEEGVDEYEIEFSNGERIVAHACHEWTVRDRTSHSWKTVETLELLDRTWLGQQGMRGSRARWQLPLVAGVDFPARDLPIPPYVLGVWLGDGTATQANITSSAEDAAVLQRELALLGYPHSGVYVHAQYGTHRTYFGKTGLLKQLRELGVLNNKHVPEIYLRGDKTQRLELLAGLMDTDGHVEAKTGRARFVTTSEALRDAVFDLATTLGYRPYVSKAPPATTSSGVAGRLTVYTVGFQPTETLPTRLERHKILRVAPQRRVSIVAVRKVQGKPGRCIQVSAHDGLYLVGRQLIPTHNSLIASDHFVSWAMGKHPEWEFISTSYAVNLPIGFSRKIRDRIRSPEHQAVFPDAKLRADATGVEEWMTTAGGRYRAAGVGGGITGTGANILLVDDPYADDEAAQSETQRAKVIDWFNTTAYSRLAPGGGVLIIHTRWHDADLTGALLLDKKEQLEEGASVEEIDDWELVTYPAIAEEDEYLMPDGTIQRGAPDEPGRLLRQKGEALTSRYDLNKLNRIRNRLTKSQWNALYQQNPVPDDGDYFTKDDFQFYHTLPGTRDEYTFFSAWDFAIELKKRNDWTVGITGAMNSDGDIYIVDMFRARVGTHGIVEAIADTVQRWDVAVLGMEDGQIKKTLQPIVEDELKRRKLYPSFDDELKPLTDKLVRARPLQGMMQRRRIFFPLISMKPWVEKLYNEFLRFPFGVHDDCVDAGAWLARMSARIAPPVFKRRKSKQQRSWKQDLKVETSEKSFLAA